MRWSKITYVCLHIFGHIVYLSNTNLEMHMNHCIKHIKKQPTFTHIHLQTKTYHMTPTHSHTYTHIHLSPTNPLKHSRSLPVTHSEAVILTVQSNSSLFYRLTVWFIAFCCAAVWAQILAAGEEGNTQLLPFMALFHHNNGAVILKWHPCAIQYSTQHILSWLFIITMRRMTDLRLSKCDFDLVFTRKRKYQNGVHCSRGIVRFSWSATRL